MVRLQKENVCMSGEMLYSEKIARLRVRNMQTIGCHVPDNNPDGYRSITIPKDALGTLTGEIYIAPEGADENACNAFIQNMRRVKKILRSPDLFRNMNTLPVNYWEATKTLNGDAFIASRIAFIVRWEGIADAEPGTLNCGSYMPWLELVEK